MKKISIFFLALTAMLLTSCKDERGIYKEFEIEYAYTVRVPADAVLSLPVSLFANEKESNAETQFEINDTRKNLVEEVFLKSLHLEIVSPQDEDFSFLKSAEFFMDTEALPEIKVAEKNPVPEDVHNELPFDVLGMDLAEYIKADNFDIRAKIVTDEERTRDIEIKGYATFDVKAKIIGF